MVGRLRALLQQAGTFLGQRGGMEGAYSSRANALRRCERSLPRACL